ncbi:MAG: butyrate kinase [Bacillota bacterium]|nr:butyrate kinase [Bacillota bacterium]
MPERRILVVNPGSLSTKVALYADEQCLRSETINHPPAELAGFRHIQDQFGLRRAAVLACLERWGEPLSGLSVVVGRGGLVKPLRGGIYRVNAEMVHDLRHGVSGEHASNLGGLIAADLAEQAGVPAFVVDPVIVDELLPLARYTGFPEIKRRSIFHALNQRAVARRAARHLGKEYQETNLIVAHLGSGISVGAHRRGQVIDVNNALDGDGPFGVERAGSLPVADLIRMCFSGRWTEEELLRRVRRQGGLVGHLGVNNGREVDSRIDAGDEQARECFEAMAYQIAKEIGALAAVLEGRIDAIVLTGGLARSERLVGWIRQRVGFLAQVLVFPGEDEMEALALGALRALQGEEPVQEYA